MDSLSDPGAFRDDPAVEYSVERSVDGAEDFEYFASVAGLVAVGIPNDAGAVLLMDSPHGWRLPYGPVERGADWVETAERTGEALTDAPVTVTGVERVTETTHIHADEDGRTATSFDAVLRAAPVAGEPTADSPAFGPWETLELGWFDAVSEDAYWEHGSAVDDVRRFLE